MSRKSVMQFFKAQGVPQGGTLFPLLVLFFLLTLEIKATGLYVHIIITTSVKMYCALSRFKNLMKL